MSNFPQDVYARNLLSHRGYPLWTPEPPIELPDSYQRGGLRIGDIGFVVPEDGSFDVFFNITLPREHPLHAPDGVPDNFSQVELRREDYRIVPDAESPGRVISSSSVECTVSCVDPFSLDGEVRSLTDHQFNLCRNEGAMLILPEGAERYRLAKELLLLDVIVQNAVDWYRFARERLYRNIRNDALYLVTGFHKARSWSLASFQNTGAAFARCRLVQLSNGGPISTTHSTWETVRPLEWRIGPRHSYGIPNQSVFITGFKIAVREELLHLKRVTVKADHLKRTLASRLVGFGASLANVLVGGASGALFYPEAGTRDEAGDQSTVGHDKWVDKDEDEDVTVERVPHVSEVFHPSDIINNYLLTRVPSAKIAVTHDSYWIALLEKGKLTQDELMQEGCLEAAVSREYRIAIRDGAVYLENIELKTSSFTINNTVQTPSDSERASDREWSGHHTSPSQQLGTPATSNSSYRFRANGSQGERYARISNSKREDLSRQSNHSHPSVLDINLETDTDSLPSTDEGNLLPSSAPVDEIHLGRVSEGVADKVWASKIPIGVRVSAPMSEQDFRLAPGVPSGSLTPYPMPWAWQPNPASSSSRDTVDLWSSEPPEYPFTEPTAPNTVPFLPAESPTNARIGDQTASGARQPKKSKMHQCELCKKMFPRLSGLATHMKSHSGARPYKCIVANCNKSFAVRSNAMRHLRTHGINSSSPDAISMLCSTVGLEGPMVTQVHGAGKQSSVYRGVTQNPLSHESQWDRQSSSTVDSGSSAGLTFQTTVSSATSFTLSSVSDEQVTSLCIPSQLPVASSSTITGNSARSVMLNSSAPIRLPLHDSTLLYPTTRRRHPALFECPDCGQSFTALFSLKRHAQSHTGERPFACSIPGCSQRVFNEDGCKHHEKSEHPKHLMIQPPSGVSIDLDAQKDQSGVDAQGQ